MRKCIIAAAILIGVVASYSSVGVAASKHVVDGSFTTTTMIVGSLGHTATVTTTVEAPHIIPPSDTVNCGYCPNCYYQEWSQSAGGSWLGFGWKETHKGGRYWNCRVIWQASRTTWDKSGYHHCGYHSGTGFSISTDACWRHGDPSFDLMDDAERFTVNFIAKGFPFQETYEMCPYFDPFGGSRYKPTCL